MVVVGVATDEGFGWLGVEVVVLFVVAAVTMVVLRGATAWELDVLVDRGASPAVDGGADDEGGAGAAGFAVDSAEDVAGPSGPVAG